jgi:hypothetical protein
LTRLSSAGRDFERSTTSTSRSRWLETMAVAFPETTTANGFSPPATPAWDGSMIPGRRSSSAITRRAVRSMTEIESL